jgi:hypothetical protein
MAFSDDRTPFIVHWAMMTNKRAETTAEILRTALTLSQRPCVLGTDNGGEFVGSAFQQVLLEFNVKFWHTAPRTPEQNGEIERFWRTLDKSRNGSVDLRKITRIINLYNHRWRRRALKMTPAQARQVSTHWSTVAPVDIYPDIRQNHTCGYLSVYQQVCATTETSIDSRVRERSSTNSGTWAEWDRIRIHPDFDGLNSFNGKAEWQRRTNNIANKTSYEACPGA